jgi:hypothetical protein
MCSFVPAFAMVVAMSDNRVDPSGNTEAFRAFTDSSTPAPPAASRTPLIVGGVVVAVVLIGLIVFLVS